MDWAKVRDEFPITRSERVFLNQCKVAVIPQAAVDAMHHFCSTVAEHGVDYPEKAGRYDRFRQRAAALIGAGADEIAFATNTAQGINWVANGLSWHEGDNVVTTSMEFPDNMFPWLYLAENGVETRVVRPHKGRVTVDQFVELMDERTRLVALSHVQFADGYRADIAAIGRACRERKVLFLVDAIQSLGAVPVNVEDSCIDFLACGGHKWLLGPLGSGLFYCRRERLDALRVTTIGTASMAPGHPLLSYHLEFRGGADRFEGAPAKNCPGFYGLDASLGILLDIGSDAIERRILSLTDRAIEGLRTRGYDVVSPHDVASERSGIVTFARADRDPAALTSALAEQNIIVSPSPLGVRVAPHIYNNEDDIDRFLVALDSDAVSVLATTSTDIQQAAVQDFFDTQDKFLRTFWAADGTHHWGYFDPPDTEFHAACDRLDAIMVDAGKIDESSNVLDVGCGNGVTAIRLAHQRGCRAAGLDLSPLRIDNANRAVAQLPEDMQQRLSFHRGSATDLPFPDNTFTHAWSQATIYRIPDRDAVLSEVFRVLSPGGCFVFDDVTMPKPEVSAVTREWVYDRWELESTFSLDEYRQALERAGFRVEQAKDLSPHLGRTFDSLRVSTQAKAAEPSPDQAKYEKFSFAYQQIVNAVEIGELGWALFVAIKP